MSGRTLCVIFGNDAALAAMLVWSLPATQIDGYLIVGSPAMAHLGRLPGCLGVIAADLASKGDEVLDALDRRVAGRPVVAMAADDVGCDFLARMGPSAFQTVLVAPPTTLATLRDKWSFDRLCRRLDLPTPQTRLLGDKTDIDIDAVLTEFGGRVVIKPTNLHGGQGVTVVDSADAFRRKILDNPDYRHAPLIGQAWIQGRNLSVSLLARDGEILHCAIQCRGDRRTDFVRNDRLLAAIRTLTKETGFSGLANFDARQDLDGQVWLLECNPRPWASLGQSSWAGLNFVRAAFQLARGKASAEPVLLNQGAAPDLLWWWLALGLTPWRWLGLPGDQKRLARGALLSFAALGWAGRWRKIRARLSGADG